MLGLFRLDKYNLVIWGYVAYTFALGAFAFWGPTFLEKVHGLSTARADAFFGGVLIFSGLAGTLSGGFAATLWQRRNQTGYARLLSGSVLLSIPSSFLALISSNTALAMSMLALSMFLLFLCTGPVNTLIIETVPVYLRSSAMALSIFLIHLFGDMGSPEIVGRLADSLNHNLRMGLLILPVALLISGLLWFWLALKIKAEPLS
jgi:MFS family permease